MKLFDGFQLDVASDLTGLTKGEISYLVKQNVVSPEKTRNGFKFVFADILMLRLVWLLKFNGVRVVNIKRAKKYLADIDPSRRLNAMQLYIRADKKQILYLGESPDKGLMVNMSEYGQLVAKNLLTIMPVGKHLEAVRLNILEFDSTLSKRLDKPGRLIPMEEVFKRYAK